MMSKSGPPTVRCSWTLLLGPGQVLSEALPLLEVLAQTHVAGGPSALEQLEEWNALFCDLPKVGRILIDTHRFELRDTGLLRSFLEHSPDWELVLLGSDPSPLGLRELLRLSGTRWLASPLDLESLARLLEAPRAADQATPDAPPAQRIPQPPAPAQREPRSTQRDVIESRSGGPGPTTRAQSVLLEQVERILSGDSEPSRVRMGGPPSPEAPIPATPVPAVPVIASPPPPAPYFKHQVADLADLVQCVDLGLDQAALDVTEIEGPAADRLAAQFEQLSSEIARLRQFTHTLSFLAAPPAAGQQSFDLAPWLEEMLSSRRAEPHAPRYLLRVPGPLLVRSDKILLSQAFDALLFLCQQCAQEEGSVRVDGRLVGEAAQESEKLVEVSIRFPAGRFEDLLPAQILEPYALRRELPELGANSLAAATGIVRGQGGSVELHKEPQGGLEWLVRLPEAR